MRVRKSCFKHQCTTGLYASMCVVKVSSALPHTDMLLHVDVSSRRHLRETLVTSNSGDLNKLTACSLILLGQIFLSLGNTKVSG